MGDIRVGRPTGRTHSQDDVRADEGREEHDLGAQKEPHAELRVVDRNAHLQRGGGTGMRHVVVIHRLKQVASVTRNPTLTHHLA